MLRGLRLIHRSQKGFTLYEMLIAILITGLLAGGLSTLVWQIIDVNARSTNHMNAVRQVQNAGFWVTHDVMMAQTVSVNSTGNGFPLKINWVEWDGTTHTVTYNITNGNLWRRDTSNTTSQTLVAKDINGSSTNVTLSGNATEGKVLYFTVTATVPIVGTGTQQQTETRIYQVKPRPSLTQ